MLADKRPPTSDGYGPLRKHVAASGAPTQVIDLLDKVYAEWEAE